MTLLRRIARGPGGQRVGHATGRAGRQALERLLEALLPRSPRVALEEVRDVGRVLLVRPNFRIGNTLMTNAVIPALRERFPAASLEVLAGDTTRALLDHLPIDGIHPMSRRYVGRPWEFLALFRRLRRRRFDVALEAGMGSFSGALYSWLSGARYRIGFEGSGERFLNVLLPRPVCAHAYDDAREIGVALGMRCADRPLYAVGEDEAEEARELLASLGLARGPHVVAHFGIFVGGHLQKRWPTERWIRFVRALENDGIPFVVFLGPEEASLEQPLRAELRENGRLLPPRPLRLFAAVLARCSLLVTPDSGPMHLGAALGVPTIAFLQGKNSNFYAPRGPLDRAIASPDVPEALAAVRTHPTVSGLLAGPGPMRQSND